MKENGRISNVAEVQKIELNILKVARDFFEQNNIQYFLAYGTMLGSIRHKGFIPWDDDIDIFVPRVDYEKLINCARRGSRLLEDRYLIQCPKDIGYPFPFVKIVDTKTVVEDEKIKDIFPLSVWIDIFPLDCFPVEETDKKALLETQMKLRKILYSGISDSYKTGNIIKDTIKYLLYIGLGGYRGICKKIDSNAKKSNKQNCASGFVGNAVWAQYGRDYFSNEMVYPIVQSEFCDDAFGIPLNFDAHLEYLYHDYMTPPPEDKRVRHEIVAYYKK